MKSTYLTNLLLLVVAVLLVWLMTEKQAPESLYIIDDIDAAQINEITVLRRGQQPIILQRHPQWQLIEPINVRANQTRINLLLSLLKQPVQPPIPVTDSTDLAQFGLQQPALTLIFNQYRFAFGTTEPLSRLRYILHEQHIYLFNDDISPLLSASASSFVDNRLLSSTSEIVAISLPKLYDHTQTEHAALSLFRENNQWHSRPENYAQDKLLVLLQNWQQAYAMQVVILSDADKKALDNTPEVTIKFADNTQRTFAVHFNEQSLTLIDKQQQLKYQFPAAIFSALFTLND